MAKQWVYLNTTAKQDLTGQLGREPDDDAVRARLGGMGLAMVRWQEAGLPVPPLFVIAADAALAYLETGALPDGLWPQVEAGIHTLEARTGKTFGGTDNPLIVSVRGTPRHPMPGVMGGVRTLGLTPDTTAALAALSGDPASTYRMYADAIVDFADAVHGVDRAQFDPVWEGRSDDRTAWDWRAVASACLSRYRDAVGEPFPQDPDRQLDLAIRAVFRQWESPRAVHYREHEDLPHAWGLGVAVASWVFGNLGADSGAGMVFSRHPVTGERALYGGFVSNALSYEAYASYDRLVPDGLASLCARYPQAYAQLADLVRKMETRERDAQHLEFVVEQGRLWVVAVRSAKRSARAAVRIVRDMVDEGLISADEARDRLGAMEWGTAVTTDLDPEAAARARAAGRLLAQGTGVSPGAAFCQVSSIYRTFRPDQADRT